MTTLGYLRSVREWAYPERKTSAFLEKGVLTPEEFVHAGDELVYRCPTWCWESGDPKKIKSYLPPDKQYLVTRNVPCQSRVSSMENHIATEGGDGENALDDDELGDWLVSSIIKQEDGDDTKNKDDEYGDIDDEFDILDGDGEVVEKKEPEKPPAATPAPAPAMEDDDEYADMADFEDDNIMVDDAAAVVPSSSTPAQQQSSSSSNTNVVKVRTYDLSITYDKYYQTPRVWMVGKSEAGQPLTGKEMMEDVISDYANRTVTIENHPHVSGPHASIHPCQHGKVMKAIVRNLIKDKDKSDGGDTNGGEEGDGAATNKGPSVEMYIFIFLKFVSSIIPTINYDFTMDVTASTSK